jgi:hypothetical protein
MNSQNFCENQAGGGGGADPKKEGFYGTLTAPSFWRLSRGWGSAREQKMDHPFVMLDAGAGLLRSSMSEAFFSPTGSIVLGVQVGSAAAKARAFMQSHRLRDWRNLDAVHDPLARMEVRLVQSCCGEGLPASLDGVDCVLCVWHGWVEKDKRALARAFAAAPSAQHLCVVEKAPTGPVCDRDKTWDERVAISLTRLGFGELEPRGMVTNLKLSGSGEAMHAFFCRKRCATGVSLAAGEGNAGGRAAKRLLDLRQGDGSGIQIDRFGKCADP